jgi:hypothetical protein
VRTLALIPAFLFLIAQAAAAQNFSLPLNGYFHPGRAMPIACDFFGSAGSAKLSGDGAITTQIFSVTGAKAIVPYLTFDPEAHSGNLQLRALEDSQLLIADAAEDPAAAARLFAGKPTVTIRLDPVHPIEGPPMAWETLDGLILTPIGLANIPQPALRQLWSAGTTIAVIGGKAPSADLPWKNQDGYWIANGMKSLPAEVNPDVYAPTLQWVGGKSLANRRETVLLATLFAILLAGVDLWPGRAAPLAAVGLAAAFWLAAGWNSQRHSLVSSAEGIVQMDLREPWCVDDLWAYQRSHCDTDFDCSVSGSLHPVMMDQTQWSQADLVLTCGSDGSPVAIHGKLKADQPIAMVMRRETRGDFLAGGPVDSPLRLLAGLSLYADFPVAGQRGPTQWGAETARTHFGSIVLRGE